jgi:pimeloyl-ACP methyl ester carboxylesterase
MRSWAVPGAVGGDGRLVVHDWGGDGAPVLLAHPTGFHGTVWLPIARRLVGAGRHVLSFDFRGHGRSTRSEAGYDWSGFADDVLAVVDALGLAGDATLLPAGHSKGGAAFLLAEARAPGTFPRIWCYEPIVIPGEPTRLGEDDPLVAGALRRRAVWASREAALDAFASRPPLQVLDADALRAYVDHGFLDVDGGVALACRPGDEAEMYALRAAHDAWRVLPEIRCPVHVVCGDATDAMTPRLCRRVVDRLPRATLEVRPGLGHFGPLQDPAAAAASILAFG